MALFKSEKKKELTQRQCRALYLFLSFALPAFVMLIALAGLKIAPFGSDTLLLADANAFYINTLSYAARMFRGMESAFYSFEKGLGGNMMGHLCGILVTPFGSLLSLGKIGDYPIIFTFISVLNLSLGGLTMYIFLADIYGHKRSNLIFSTSYALMGFNVANVFQAVFFCAPPVVPIMAMGLRRIMKGKSPAIYILSIAYGVAVNPFFGFVLCMASLIFFGVGIWQSALDKAQVKRLVLKYLVASVCGGMMVAVMWLPGFLSLRGGRIDQLSLGDFSMWENMPFIEIGAKLFTGANSVEEEVHGLPNIFVGILPVILGILYFRNQKVRSRDKVAAGVLLCIYLASFWLNSLNLIMHAGATTNWFNYRHSYVFSFILLAVAAESWTYLGELTGEEVKKALVVLVIATIIIFSKKYEFIQAGTMVLDLVILALILFVWKMHKKDPEKNDRRNFEIAVIELVCFNLLMNYSICTHKIEGYPGWEMTIEDYRDVVNNVSPLVESAKAKGDDFYRIEINEQRAWNTGNDPMLYGYDGVGHGGSNGRDFERIQLCTLGIPWDDMRSCYSSGVTPATDSLLGLRYIVAKADLTEEKGYEKVGSMGEWGLYKNDHALAPVFLADKKVKDVHTNFVNIFDNLNRTWKGISGTDKDVFIMEDDITFEAHSSVSTGPVKRDDAKERVIFNAIGGKGILEQDEENDDDGSLKNNVNVDSVSVLNKPADDEAYISYSLEAKYDGPIYIYDRSSLRQDSGCPISTVQYIGTYHKGDTVVGYFPMSDGIITQKKLDSIAGYFRAAYLQTDRLWELNDGINEQKVDFTRVKDTLLTGSFDSASDQVLMFTIPYDEGWTLTIDGQNAEIEKTIDLFMTADIPMGSHSFELKYTPPGLLTGKILSVFSILFFVIYIIYDVKKRKPTDDPIEKTDEKSIIL